MSRKLKRAMQRADKRRAELTEEALESLVLMKYGPTTSLADLHPDVRELFYAAMDLNASVVAGDTAWMTNAIGGICAMITRYGEDDLPKDTDRATMSPINMGHDNAQTDTETAIVVGAALES